MYILVHHTISDPATAWSRAQAALPSVPAHLKLHHSIPTPDGSTAHNSYFEVVNKEGVALPTALQPA